MDWSANATGGAHVPTHDYGAHYNTKPAGAQNLSPETVMAASNAARGRASMSKPSLSNGLLLASSTGSQQGARKPARPNTNMVVPQAFSALRDNLTQEITDFNVQDSLTQSICAPEGGQEMVYKLIAQSAAATSTVQSVAETAKKNTQMRNVQPNVLAQTVQGTSTYGTWEVDLSETFPTQQVVSMEISGWTLPPSQWTVEAQRNNVALGFGTFFDLESRIINLVLGGGQSGVSPVTYQIVMSLQKAECFEVQRVDDEFGVPSGRIRFFFVTPIGSYFRTTVLRYQIWQGAYSLQGLRGAPQGAYILDPTKMPTLENNRTLSNFIEVIDPELVEGIDSLGLWANIEGRTLMKPRVLGDIILPQCALVAPAVPSPYQLADLINAIAQETLNDTNADTAGPNAIYGNIFSFACNYKPELDRFQIDFQIKNGPGSPDEPGFEERLALINASPHSGITTPLNEIISDQLFIAMGFNTTVIPNADIANVSGRAVKILGMRQRVHPPNAYVRVEPGVYETGARLAAAVNAAFDAAWFGPENESPENGNPSPFVLTIRKSTGQNVYVNVRSGRYTPQQLATVVQQAARVALQCASGQVTCDNPDCDLGLTVRPLIIVDTNFFVGLTFESPFGITFELQFAEATTTINPESIGYKRRAYTGSSTYFPDAAGTLAGATITSVPVDGGNANLLRIQTSQSSVIAEEYFNGRHVPLYQLGNISGFQLAPFRLQAIFDEKRRHMTLESISLPAMHNCFVLCEDEEASALFLETPIAHGLAPGAVLTLNIGAGSWLTGLSTITPGMSLAARDKIIELATDIASQWSSALSIVSSCQSQDPNAQGVPANADAWRRLVAAVAYGISAAQAYIQWCTFIKPYIRTVTLSFATSQQIALTFFNTLSIVFCNIIECEFQLFEIQQLLIDTGLIVQTNPSVFAIAYNFVCRTLSTVVDVMFSPYLAGGAKTDNLCYYMYVTLSSVYNFTDDLASYARTNAVVVTEPEPLTTPERFKHMHPVVDKMRNARVALTGGDQEFRSLSSFLNNEPNYLGFGRNKRDPYYVSTKQSISRAADVCTDFMKYYQYLCGGAEVETEDVVGEGGAEQDTTKRGFYKGHDAVSHADSEEEPEAFGHRADLLRKSSVRGNGDDEDVVMLAPAAGRLNTSEALSNMEKGVGASSKPLTAAQHTTEKFLTRRKEKLVEASDRAKQRGNGSQKKRLVSHKHIVMLNSSVDEHRDDFAESIVRTQSAEKELRQMSGILLHSTGAPESEKWLETLSQSMGHRAALQAAKRLCARAKTEEEMKSIRETLQKNDDPCTPLLKPNCAILPPVFDRIVSCTDQQNYVGNTCAALCGGPSGPQCSTTITTLPPRESRLLLILGRYPANTTQCSSWPFSTKILTNVRVIPTVNDIYEVNMRDPPPTLNVNGDGPAIRNMLAPNVLGFEPVPVFSFGFRVISAPNVVTLTGPPFCILDVSIDPQEDIVQSGGYNPLFNYAGKGKIVTPQRVLTQAVFFGSVAAGEVDKRLVIPLNNITKVQRVVVKVLTPDNRPVNFHGQNASLLLRLVVIGQRTTACGGNGNALDLF